MYDRLMLQDRGKKKSSVEGTAFGANASSKKGKWKGKHLGGDCNNCGWHGHKECDCWEEGGGKAGQALKNWKSCGKKPKDENSKSHQPLQTRPPQQNLTVLGSLHLIAYLPPMTTLTCS